MRRHLPQPPHAGVLHRGIGLRSAIIRLPPISGVQGSRSVRRAPGRDPALRRAGLRKLRFHDLRHCYASLLIDSGEPLLVVSRLLGHSSIKITADTYGHLMPDIVEGVGQRLGDRVFGAVVSQDGNFLGTAEDSEPKPKRKRTQIFEIIGGPYRNRTYDQWIKSLLIFPFISAGYQKSSTNNCIVAPYIWGLAA